MLGLDSRVLWITVSACAFIVGAIFPLSAGSGPREVFSVYGNVRCLFRHEGWFATTTGPCKDFTSPTRIVVGAAFKANGKERVIGAMNATQSDRDWSYNGFEMRKGEWACAAGESEADPADGRL